MTRPIALALFGSLLASMASAQSGGGTATDKSYQEARKVLDAALEAAGGVEALKAVKTLSRTGKGTNFNQGQSPRPDVPYSTSVVEVVSFTDFSGGRSYNRTDTTPTGGLRGSAVTVLNGDAGFAFNRVTRVATPMAAGTVTGAKAALRRDPAVLLLTAAGRAESLRLLGDETLDGRKHRVLTFADSDGTQIGLYVDAQTGLVSRYETLADHPVLGDAVAGFAFSDHRAVGKARLPFRIQTLSAGEVTRDLQYSEMTPNAPLAEASFDPPAGAVAGLAPAPPTVVLTQLADGVYFVEGGSHNSLAVAMSDHVVVVEGPLNEERTRAVMAKVQEAFPGKPIRAVVPTHYHFDHSGGLRGYVAAGATVVTTAGNRAFVEKMATTPHTLRPDALSRSPRKPVIDVFSKKKVLQDASRSLELHDVGPNPHVEEMVVAYLPKEKILFVSDLFSNPVRGPFPPASAALKDFAAKIKALGLQVETIAPGHGPLGKPADLQKALETAPATND